MMAAANAAGTAAAAALAAATAETASSTDHDTMAEPAPEYIDLTGDSEASLDGMHGSDDRQLNYLHLLHDY